MNKAMRLVCRERKNQINHGYDAEYDDGHPHGELAMAAACFVLPPEAMPRTPLKRPGRAKPIWVPALWPFDINTFTRYRKNRLGQLVVGAAFLIAEIERWLRVADEEDWDAEFEYQIVWDNGIDTGAFQQTFILYSEADAAAQHWRNDLISEDPNPEEAEEAYTYDIVPVATNLPSQMLLHVMQVLTVLGYPKDFDPRELRNGTLADAVLSVLGAKDRTIRDLQKRVKALKQQANVGASDGEALDS